MAPLELLELLEPPEPLVLRGFRDSMAPMGAMETWVRREPLEKWAHKGSRVLREPMAWTAMTGHPG